MATVAGVTTRFSFDKPDDLRATLSVNMTVASWRLIAARLRTDKYAEWPLRGAIVELISEAEKTFYHRIPEGS